MNTRQFFFEDTLQLHAGDTEPFDLIHLISFFAPFNPYPANVENMANF
jgi:hypothetical protein